MRERAAEDTGQSQPQTTTAQTRMSIGRQPKISSTVAVGLLSLFRKLQDLDLSTPLLRSRRHTPSEPIRVALVRDADVAILALELVGASFGSQPHNPSAWRHPVIKPDKTTIHNLAADCNILFFTPPFFS